MLLSADVNGGVLCQRSFKMLAFLSRSYIFLYVFRASRACASGGIGDQVLRSGSGWSSCNFLYYMGGYVYRDDVPLFPSKTH